MSTLLTQQSLNLQKAEHWDLRRFHMESYTSIQIEVQVFTAPLFVVAKILEQPKRSSKGTCWKQLRYIQTLEDYAAIKNREVNLHTVTWKEVYDLLMVRQVPAPPSALPSATGERGRGVAVDLIGPTPTTPSLPGKTLPVSEACSLADSSGRAHGSKILEALHVHNG